MNPTLYFLHYNNYYNRTVKREPTLQAYQQYVITQLENVTNWNPNDGLSAKQVINWSYGGVYDTPDYMLVVNDDGVIDSRWFVIEATRTRAMQLELTLYRDVVVDFYTAVLQAPCFIEKALPKSIRDPALYNSENMSYNQIKQGEKLLYDETGCPWIVGYIPRDSFKEDTPVKVQAQLEGTASITVEHITDYEFYSYNNQAVNADASRLTYTIGLYSQGPGENTGRYYDDVITVDGYGNFIGFEDREAGTFGIGEPGYTGFYNVRISPDGIRVAESNARAIVSQYPQIAADLSNPGKAYLPTALSQSELSRLLADEGKTIYESSTGKYYTITLLRQQGGVKGKDVPQSSGLFLKMWNYMKKSDIGAYNTALRPLSISSTQSPNEHTFVVAGVDADMVLKIEPREVNISTTVPATRYKAPESPYDIFCLPYSDDLTINKGGQTYIAKTNKFAALTIAQGIAAAVGSGNIYDVQLLPYCPVRYCIQDDGSFDIGTAIYSDVLADTNKASVLLWATSDNVSFTIPVSIPEKQDTVEKKVASETEFIRIVAPNYSNSFQFNPQMNNGLTEVNVLCCYKPFNPYIKVQPSFSGMYGASYNDARGLVALGDYSLAQITSAWANYELQNKNYQSVFNREIQNLEVNNAVQREQEKWAVGAGALSAAVGGAAAGGMFGGAIGAGIGGAVGGAASLFGGLRDIELNETLRNEALDYRKDMFGYQLGNIRALPYGLAKTSAIAPDNKLVPFIEFYSCTPEEKDALRNKIKYNGCTIMMIGTIMNYIRQGQQTYIKGRLIRLEGITEDYDLCKALADEIYKGVFI